jgi:hypothetical protein
MKNGKLIFAASVFAVFMTAGISFGQPTPGTSVKAVPTETQPAHLSRREILKRLQLTADQRKALRLHKAAFRKTMAEIEGKLKVKQVELENELDKPEIDQVRLDLIIQKISELYGEKLSAQVKAKIELERKILTPQQSDLLETLQGKKNSATEDNL